jgi:hypothetical protein
VLLISKYRVTCGQNTRMNQFETVLTLKRILNHFKS